MSANIPHVIHTMWLDKDPLKRNEEQPPRTTKHYLASWQEHNPDFQFEFWNYHRVFTYMQSTPAIQRFLPMFESIEPWICKCDVARYAILYARGGVYADLDFECQRPLDELLQDRSVAMSRDLDMPLLFGDTICNAFLAITPRHPFMFQLLQKIEQKQNYFAWGYRLSPVSTVMAKTGPRLLRRVLEEYNKQQVDEKQKIQLVPPCYLYPLSTTFWDHVYLALFPKAKLKEKKHACCENVPSFAVTHKLEGSNWGLGK